MKVDEGTGVSLMKADRASLMKADRDVLFFFFFFFFFISNPHESLQ